MLENVRIRNYRVLRNLRIHKLGRINLVSGHNNSGKTSLMEAIFLWTGAGNPGLIMSPNIMRGLERFTSAPDPELLASICWHPLFYSLDFSRTIDIRGYAYPHGYMSLTISSERPDFLELPLGLGDETTFLDSLVFSFGGTERTNTIGKVHLQRENIRVEQPSEDAIIMRSMFVSSHAGHSENDAMRLGQLRKQKQGHHVLEALRAIDPRIESVQDSVAGGIPLIWIDIGLDEFVPLPTAGEGMNRMAGIVLAMASSRGGMVLIDEIENGIHHSVLDDLWRAIDQSSKYFDVQVFATTHSFECVAAAHRSLDENDLLVHRLEAHNGETDCTTFEPVELALAVERGYDIR